MARTTLTDKRAKLAEKQRQIAEQLKTLDARAKAQERKDDTRRKVVAGALAIRHAELNPGSDFARQMTELIAGEVAAAENEKTKETLRKLFAGLLPELALEDATPPAPAQTDVAPPLAATETTSRVRATPRRMKPDWSRSQNRSPTGSIPWRPTENSWCRASIAP